MRVPARLLSRALLGCALLLGIGVGHASIAAAQGTNTIESSTPGPGETVTTIKPFPDVKKSSRPSRDQSGISPPSVETMRRSPSPRNGATNISFRESTVVS